MHVCFNSGANWQKNFHFYMTLFTVYLCKFGQKKTQKRLQIHTKKCQKHVILPIFLYIDVLFLAQTGRRILSLRVSFSQFIYANLVLKNNRKRLQIHKKNGENLKFYQKNCFHFWRQLAENFRFFYGLFVQIWLKKTENDCKFTKKIQKHVISQKKVFMHFMFYFWRQLAENVHFLLDLFYSLFMEI